MTLGRSTFAHSSFACSMVAAVSWAEAGGDLDRDATVVSAGAVVDGAEVLGGVAHVVGRDLEDRGVDVGACGGERVQLLGVGGAVRERTGEDRRVGGHADDVTLGDEPLESAGDDALTRQVVEPDADAGL
ncbi:hypothetical protein QFZ29_001686 [Agromyces albus]|nr:hypothetical protein [Agromyces albus]